MHDDSEEADRARIAAFLHARSEHHERMAADWRRLAVLLLDLGLIDGYCGEVSEER